MLTSDLAINWRRGDRIFPYRVKTETEGFVRDAENLIAIFEDASGKSRGEIERELDEYVGTGTDYRVLRGLIKLLTDRCEFETSAPAEPAAIREKVFLAARRAHPVLPGSAARQEVLAAAAAQLTADADAVFDGLYADLSAQQRLVSFEPLGAPQLLDRYNLAQAQALLYRAVEMRVSVAPSEAANYRAIFGWIKHFGLIHSVGGSAGDGYEITLTGAASLFQRSQKYGIQMAVFLPALLLCGNWRMRAEIGDRKGAAFYELTSEQTELVSDRYDEPEYENPVFEKLKKAWEKSSADWKLEENREVVDLGKTAFIPDFVLVSSAGEKIYLDVLGFWTPKSLEKRLEEFRAAGFRRFLLAAWQELRGSREEPLWESENVVFFKTKLEPLLLAERAEKLK